MPPPRKSTKPGTSQPQTFSSSTPAPTPTPTPAPSPVASRSEVKGSGTSSKPASASKAITQDDIARRAFEIYAGRGYAPGDPTADWLEAERQLKAGL